MADDKRKEEMKEALKESNSDPIWEAEIEPGWRGKLAKNNDRTPQTI